MNGPADVSEVASRAKEIFSLAGDEFFINHTHDILGDPPCDRRKVTKIMFALVTYNYALLPFYRRLLHRRRSCKSASRHPRFYRAAKNFTVRHPPLFIR